jgi:hypothetical protein
MKDDDLPQGVRGWLGVARDLVARVVDKGLHLPEAAQLLRGTAPARVPRAPAPLATVTLAEIYAAQGHMGRAQQVLDEVLARQPDHRDALALRQRLGGPRAAAATQEPAEAAPAPAKPAPARPAPAKPAPAKPAPAKPAKPAPAEPAPAAPAPGEPAEEAPSLPSHYDVDELVALPTDPASAYVYWELRPRRFARARARHPEGRLALRVLSVHPSCSSTEAQCRDIPIDELVGDRFVRDLQPGSELRLCLGWVGAHGFLPLVVGTEIKMPRDGEVLRRRLAASLASVSATQALRAYQSRPMGSLSFGALLSRYERGELADGEIAEIQRYLGDPGHELGGASELGGGMSSELGHRAGAR